MAVLSLSTADWRYISTYIQTFLYGIYSGLFLLYLHSQASKRLENKPTIIFYAICALFALSTIVVITNVADIIFQKIVTNTVSEDRDFSQTFMIANVLNGFCDFIAQCILIYRCWIVWNCNIRVVIIPLILAVAFLGLWITSVGSTSLSDNEFSTPAWANEVTWTSLVMCICVNAVVTGLIVFKIVRVYLDVKPLYNGTFASRGGSTLRSTIFIVIESALALLCIQIIYLVLNILTSSAALDGYQIVSFTSMYQMFNGITPTVIQVRVALGLSFDSQESLVGIASELRFGHAQDTMDSMKADEYYIDAARQENGGDAIEDQKTRENDKASEERENDVLKLH